MRRGILSTGSLVLAVVLLLAINILAATVLGGWRLDLTQNRLYTLSEGSRAVVRKLEEPITLNFENPQQMIERQQRAEDEMARREREQGLLPEDEPASVRETRR